MNFARVVGRVVATVKDPGLHAVVLRVIQPEDEAGNARGEPLVAIDPLQTREGDLVYFVRAREAAKALPGKFSPADAAILGLVDGVQIDAMSPPAVTPTNEVRS